MVHRILCVALMMMSGAFTVAAQAPHDDRALLERANRLEPFIVSAAKRYGVDPRILRAICFIESRYRIEVVSPKGARGPMQFMPGTAARYGLHDPHNPEQAMEAAARYFRDLLRRFRGRVDLALAAYNAGEGAVSSFMTGKPLVLPDGRIVNARGVKTGGIPPYVETRRYVRSVLVLLNNRVIESLDRANQRSGRVSNRNIAIDGFDLSSHTPDLYEKRASSFIEVPIDVP